MGVSPESGDNSPESSVVYQRSKQSIPDSGLLSSDSEGHFPVPLVDLFL